MLHRLTASSSSAPAPAPARTTRRAARGLTLLELAAVLAVIAILSSLALPSYTSRMARERLNEAAEALSADLAEARFLAAQAGTPVHLELEPGAPWCWTVTQRPGCGCGQPQPCQQRRVNASRYPGVSLVQAQTVSLAGDGTTSASVVAALQSEHGEQLTVRISPLGRTQICRSAGTSTRYPRC